jgi:hypothetical protein
MMILVVFVKSYSLSNLCRIFFLNTVAETIILFHRPHHIKAFITRVCCVTLLTN